MTHYYFLEDMQNGGQIMETGKNRTNLDDLHSDLINYLSVDYPSTEPENPNVDELMEWQDWQNIQKMPVNMIADLWGFKIRWSSRKVA